VPFEPRKMRQRLALCRPSVARQAGAKLWEGSRAGGTFRRPEAPDAGRAPAPQGGSKSACADNLPAALGDQAGRCGRGVRPREEGEARTVPPRVHVRGSSVQRPMTDPARLHPARPVGRIPRALTLSSFPRATLRPRALRRLVGFNAVEVNSTFYRTAPRIHLRAMGERLRRIISDLR
jgi:hypothetical protein